MIFEIFSEASIFPHRSNEIGPLRTIFNNSNMSSMDTWDGSIEAEIELKKDQSICQDFGRNGEEFNENKGWGDEGEK